MESRIRIMYMLMDADQLQLECIFAFIKALLS